MTDSTTTRVGEAAGWMVASRAVRFLLGIGSSVVVVRGLGAHDYGVLSIARTVVMFVLLFCGAGVSKGILKFLPLVRVRGSRSDARRLAAGSVGAAVALWVLASTAVLVSRGLARRVFDIPGIEVVLVVAVTLSVFELLFTVLSQLLYAAFDTRRQAVAGVVAHGVYFAGVCAVMQLDAGVVGVLLSGAAGFAVAALMLLGRVRPALQVESNAGGEAVTAARVVRYAVPLTAIVLLNMVVWRQSESLILAHFRGAEAAAYFDLAYRMPQMILEFIPGTVWPLVMAGLSTVLARDAARLPAAVGRYYRVLFLLAAPLCAVGVAFGGRAITVLYSSHMAPAAVPAQIFFAVFTLSFIANPLSMALLVLEKPGLNLLIYSGLAVVNVGLDLVLIPRYGLHGAIAPVAVAMAIAPLAYHTALRKLGVRIAIPGRYIARCFVASAPVLALGPVAARTHGVGWRVAVMLLAVPVLLVSFRLWRVVGPSEQAFLATVPVPGLRRLLKFLCP